MNQYTVMYKSVMVYNQPFKSKGINGITGGRSLAIAQIIVQIVYVRFGWPLKSFHQAL